MFRIFLVIIFSINLLYCDEISDLITQIQNADVSEKRLLVNRLKLKLKLKLRDNNNQTREQTLKTLKIKHQHSYKSIHTNFAGGTQNNHSTKHKSK